MLSNEFQEEEMQWQPPKLSDIKYSKVSEKHKRYLESKKRGGRNVKKSEATDTKGREGKKKYDGRQKVDGKTSRTDTKRR